MTSLSQLSSGMCVTVNQGYMAKIDDADLRHLVPATLRENRSVLFSNISEIHEFHARLVVLCTLPAITIAVYTVVNKKLYSLFDCHSVNSGPISIVSALP